MGNKRRANLCRTRKDPRTQTRRKSNTKRVVMTIPDTETTITTTVTDTEAIPTTSNEKLTASERKIRVASAKNLVEDDSSSSEQSCYVLMDTNIMFDIFYELLKCPKCKSNIIIDHCIEKKMGLSQFFTIKCKNSCSWQRSFYSSKESTRKRPGVKPFDVNIRTVMAFREIGKGYVDIETFCGYMNMPHPMNVKAYNSLVKDTMLPIYNLLVKEDMEEAANELRDNVTVEADVPADDSAANVSTSEGNESAEESEDNDDNVGSENEADVNDNNNDGLQVDDICDISASFDGTWQRRGYASLNGVVSAISIDTGKCLAYECLTKNCKACEMWEPRRETEEYEKFIKDHDCPINHEGSAASMETVGVLNIYKKSVDNLGLRFMTYIGDGDSKAFPNVKKAEPYGPGKIPKKGECIGHVQKRVGTRLRNFKKNYGKKKLKDGKPLGGKNRLTKKWINRLQNYYGLAIRQNTGSLNLMRKAVGAVLYHSSEATNSEARHQFCDEESLWCKYRVAQRDGTEYVEKPGLPSIIRDEIMPVFQDLSKPELLSKCLHGNTQNNNEGFNQLIWKRLPKAVYVGRHVLEMGVSSAVLNFNNGTIRMMEILQRLGLTVGYFTRKFCSGKDSKRITNLKRKMSEKGISYRKRKRAQRKGFEDNNAEKEGEVYGAGEF